MELIVKPEQLNDYVDVKEATAKEYLNLKEGTIRTYLSYGKFKLYKFKGLTLLSKKEIAEYKERQK